MWTLNITNHKKHTHSTLHADRQTLADVHIDIRNRLKIHQSHKYFALILVKQRKFSNRRRTCDGETKKNVKKGKKKTKTKRMEIRNHNYCDSIRICHVDVIETIRFRFLITIFFKGKQRKKSSQFFNPILFAQCESSGEKCVCSIIFCANIQVSCF